MISNINKKDLVMINDLVQVSSATNENKIKQYILEFNKKEKAVIVEIYHELGKYAVCLRKEMDTIEEDEIIPIENSVDFGNILTKIIDEETLDLSVAKNKVLIKTSKDTIELPYYEESEDDLQKRNNLKKAFTTRKYGNVKNKLTFYKRADKDDPNPDAECKIDLKKLNIKGISEVFNKGAIEITGNNDKFYIKIGGGKKKQTKNIERTITKGEAKDPMYVKGKSTVLLQDINCIALLSKHSGHVTIDMKKEFPFVLRKKFPEYRIGVSYLISLLEETE